MATLVTGVPDTRAVNGKPLSSDVTLTATDVGAEPSGSSFVAITQHEAKAGAHSIAGVNGLQAALDGKEASGAAAAAVAAHKSGADQHSISGVTGLQAALDSKEASGTASGLVTPLAARVTALEAKEVTSSGATGTVIIEKLGTKKLVSFVVTLAAGLGNQVFTIPVAFTSTPICIGTSTTAGAAVYGAVGIVALTQFQITVTNISSSSASSQCRITLLGE